MKVRNGYVSNSSSSSFLILLKSLGDFDKFYLFKGYDTFKKDLIEATKKEDVLEWLEVEFSNYFCNFKNDARNEYLYDQGMKDDYDCNDDLTNNRTVIMDLIYYEHICNKKTSKKLDEHIAKLRHEILSGNDPDDIIDPSKELAQSLYNELKDRGYDLRVLSYEDHSDEGSYMEHYFMKFLMFNPEVEESQVFWRSEH